MPPYHIPTTKIYFSQNNITMKIYLVGITLYVTLLNIFNPTISFFYSNFSDTKIVEFNYDTKYLQTAHYASNQKISYEVTPTNSYPSLPYNEKYYLENLDFLKKKYYFKK